MVMGHTPYMSVDADSNIWAYAGRKSSCEEQSAQESGGGTSFVIEAQERPVWKTFKLETQRNRSCFMLTKFPVCSMASSSIASTSRSVPTDSMTYSLASSSGENMISQEDECEWPDEPSSVAQNDDCVECGCCFEECAFHSMIQCEDGHLFCTTCLRRHVENCIFGGSCSSGSTLCLAITGCNRTYPRSEIKKCFSDDLWLKYEQRLAEDAVAKAKLTGLVYCFHCKHPCEVDPGTKILTCLNQRCLKETCLNCKRPSHTPDPCRNYEKSPEDTLRTQVEESMTKAVIRVCSFCSAELVKNEGCNKIMCKCGQQMCYLCRQNITDYSHFCPHIRAPQLAPCDECTMCCLWEKEDENKVVKAAKSAAMEKLAGQYPEVLKRQIGPSEDAERRARKRTAKERTMIIR